MARRLTWTEQGSSDLDGFGSYIARDSRVYTADFVRRVRAAARSLLEMAERGRIVPEYRDASLRELIVGNHRLVDRIKPDEIGIVGVIHGARQLPRLG